MADIDLLKNSSFEMKMDKLVEAISGGGISEKPVTFEVAASRENISTGEKLNILFGKIAKWFSSLGSLAFKSSVAKSDLSSGVQASLGKADTALQSYTETDPTVPAWAKAASKPKYTAAEVGALPLNTSYVTPNALNNKIGRTTNVNAADTNYTTYMARGEALFSAETTPSVNGTIAWQYE